MAPAPGRRIPPVGLLLFLGYAFVILGAIGVSLRWVVDQAISTPLSVPGIVVMVLLAYTIFTITMVLQRKQAARNLALGLATPDYPGGAASPAGPGPGSRRSPRPCWQPPSSWASGGRP